MNAADLIHWTQYWTIEILVFLFAAELKVCNFTSPFNTACSRQNCCLSVPCNEDWVGSHCFSTSQPTMMVLTEQNWHLCKKSVRWTGRTWQGCQVFTMWYLCNPQPGDMKRKQLSCQQLAVNSKNSNWKYLKFWETTRSGSSFNSKQRTRSIVKWQGR